MFWPGFSMCVRLLLYVFMIILYLQAYVNINNMSIDTMSKDCVGLNSA